MDDDLPQKAIPWSAFRTIEVHNKTIVVKDVFHENSKYYLQVFLDECLNYKQGNKNSYNKF